MKRVLITIIISILIALVCSVYVIAATGKVNQGEVNFRTDASTEGDPIRALEEGESVTIIEELDEWYKVQIGEETGYVYKTYITKDAENTESNQGTVTTSNAEMTASNKTKITADCTVFVLPLLNSTKLQSLAIGTEVEVISNAGSWSYIYTANISGWVISKNLESTKVSTSEKTNTNTVTTNTTNTVATANEDTNQNTVKNETTSENTITQEETKTEEVVSNSDVAMEKTVYVTVEALNVREKATSDSEVIDSVGEGMALDVIGKNGSWYKISLESGTGYVSEDYVSDTKPEVSVTTDEEE